MKNSAIKLIKFVKGMRSPVKCAAKGKRFCVMALLTVFCLLLFPTADAYGAVPGMAGIFKGAVRTPQFVISYVDYGDEPVQAGEDFIYTVAVMLSDGDEAMENTVVTLELPFGLSFADGNDRVYLGTIKPGYTYHADFNLHAREDLDGREYTMTARVSGVGSYYGTYWEKEDKVSVAVTPIEQLTVGHISFPERINAAYDDGSGMVEVPLTNSGHVAVHNIEIQVEGEDFKEQDPCVVETLEPSQRENAVIELSTETEGELAGELSIRFERSDGTLWEETIPFNVEGVYQPLEVDHSVRISPSVMEEDPAVPDLVWLAATMGCVAGAVVLFKMGQRWFYGMYGEKD